MRLHVSHSIRFLFISLQIPPSFSKQNCQLCLSQALIYKEPTNGRKYEIGKILHFHYKPAFGSPFRHSAADLSAHINRGRQELGGMGTAVDSKEDGF